MLIWAMLRPAPHNSSQHAQVQWQPAAGGGFRTLASVGTHSPNGVLVVHMTVPAPGTVRIGWRAPGGSIYYSRGVKVRVG
jgi:hypothetical protein